MVSGNSLVSLPTALGNLKKLHELVLDENELDSIPEELAECDSLRSLSIANNPLSGSLPKALVAKQGLQIDS